MAIQVTATALPEVKIIEPKVFGDAGGIFYESFNAREFSEQVETGVGQMKDFGKVRLSAAQQFYSLVS
jgi:dTDP-4-dehydrorhamnose 3,5-epimerase